MNKLYRILSFFGVLAFLVAQTGLAAEFVKPESESDGNVTIATTDNLRNLYVAGGSVTVNGNVQGDLYAAGGMVSVLGSVEQDLNLVGGSLAVSGEVGGDARFAGGNITINAPVHGDLLLAGGNLSISEKAEVGGDAVIGGGNVVLDAPVKGSLKIAGGNITINSKVEGNVNIISNDTLVFGPKAEVWGKIFFKGKKAAVVKDGAQIPEINFQKIERNYQHLAAFNLGGVVVQLVALFLAGWLYMHYRKTGLKNLFTSMENNPWGSVGLGFAGLILIPIACLLLLVTIVGYYLALLLVLSYVLLLMLVCVAAALFVGNWVMEKVFKQENAPGWQIALLGAAIWKLFGVIPIVGWVIGAFVFLAALGAGMKIIKQKLTDNA